MTSDEEQTDNARCAEAALTKALEKMPVTPDNAVHAAQAWAAISLCYVGLAINDTLKQLVSELVKRY